MNKTIYKEIENEIVEGLKTHQQIIFDNLKLQNGVLDFRLGGNELAIVTTATIASSSITIVVDDEGYLLALVVDHDGNQIAHGLFQVVAELSESFDKTQEEIEEILSPLEWVTQEEIAKTISSL